MANQWQDVLDLLGQKKAKKASDTLKANRTYKDELYKASPGYRAQQERDKETKEIKSRQDLADAKKKNSPQEDILRFGKKIKEYRDLAYKEKVISESDGDNKVDRIQYLPRKDNEIFKGQMEAYGDSLKLANIAQQYKENTPRIRGIDKDRIKITKEYEEAVKKYANDTPEFTKSSAMSSVQLAKKRAGADLMKKYGKGILNLLNDLENR